ncbi:MAG: hypothetical protein WD294_04905 [Phycisphaeraceae bacterium]
MKERSCRGTLTTLMLTLLLLTTPALAADPPVESDYYRIITVPVPDDVVLEVGGLATLDDERVLVATRRGDIYSITGIYGDEPNPEYTRFATGLAEPLGLLVHDDGWIYTAQRGELTRLKDTTGNGYADRFETVSDAWEISGNYHEYNFGPRLDHDGNFWITTNKPFGGEPWGKADWRGWALKITPDGEMQPVASGLRSPAGIEISPDGEAFYSDNQGEWTNASKISHIAEGDFHGHPHGLFTFDSHGDQIPFDPPGDVPSGEFMMDLTEQIPSFKMPAVFLPRDRLGRSPAGMVWDTTEGEFGPFEGQLFVSDQYEAAVYRVALEQVGGHWQGAVFRFREGFQCGIVRVAWGADNSMLVGMSQRGWGALGGSPYGLQRLEWTGEMPFEIHTMHATPDGFELTFTQPVDAETAAAVSNYELVSYTYRLRSDYGGPDEDKQTIAIEGITVAEDGRSVRLTVSELKRGYVHELRLPGVRSAEGLPLLHDTAFYTLVNIP